MYTVNRSRVLLAPSNLRPPPIARGYAVVWAAVVAGREPAETLPSAVRAALFRLLVARGWTVSDIGAWTRTTEYTVSRMIVSRGCWTNGR